MPDHVAHPWTAGGVGPAAGFTAALASRLRLRDGLPLHVHCAFGGTSALAEHEAAVAAAYRTLAAEWRRELKASQVVVIDGATRMGHIVHLERELAELKRTSGADPAIASVGVTSAASLREPGAGQFNCSHELSLIVDAPDGSADWGFETAFFLHAIKLLCDARSGGQPLTLTASFVNGGMVTAKELAFLGLALPRIRDDRAARARIDIFGRTGRLAALAAAARDRRVPLLVEFGNAAADGYRVEMTFGGRYMTSRVMAAVDPAGAALRTSVERPLQPSEAAYLRRLAEAGEARRCAVRFLP